MENLMFCLNATGPIFLMMVFGLFLRKVGILDEDFANRMNKFVFKIPLPFLLFSDLASVDFSRVWNIKFIVFCFVVTLISITISTLVSCLWRDKSIRESLYRPHTEAVRHCLELPLSRIFMETQAWHLS